MKHYDPPRRFLVTRLEICEVLVDVEAPSADEARRLVYDDYGTIVTDPEFHSYTDPSLWTVEEVTK